MALINTNIYMDQLLYRNLNIGVGKLGPSRRAHNPENSGSNPLPDISSYSHNTYCLRGGYSHPPSPPILLQSVTTVPYWKSQEHNTEGEDQAPSFHNMEEIV